MPLFLAPLETKIRIAKIIPILVLLIGLLVFRKHYILTDEKTKHHLLNLGLCVGTEVTVVSHSANDLIIKVLDTTLALNKDTALKIIVA